MIFRKEEILSLHWKLKIVMMPISVAVAALQVVIMITCGTANNRKVGIMTTLSFW